MSDRKRGDGGEFIQEIDLEEVMDVFNEIEGPALTSADVAEILDCSEETARNKLSQLIQQGRVAKRKSAGRNIYWRKHETPKILSPDDPIMNRTTFKGGEPHDVSSNVDKYLYGKKN